MLLSAILTNKQRLLLYLNWLMYFIRVVLKPLISDIPLIGIFLFVHFFNFSQFIQCLGLVSATFWLPGSESAKICESTDPRGKISYKNCNKNYLLSNPKSEVVKKNQSILFKTVFFWTDQKCNWSIALLSSHYRFIRYHIEILKYCKI